MALQSLFVWHNVCIACKASATDALITCEGSLLHLAMTCTLFSSAFWTSFYSSSAQSFLCSRRFLLPHWTGKHGPLKPVGQDTFPWDIWLFIVREGWWMIINLACCSPGHSFSVEWRSHSPRYRQDLLLASGCDVRYGLPHLAMLDSKKERQQNLIP